MIHFSVKIIDFFFSNQSKEISVSITKFLLIFTTNKGQKLLKKQSRWPSRIIWKDSFWLLRIKFTAIPNIYSHKQLEFYYFIEDSAKWMYEWNENNISIFHSIDWKERNIYDSNRDSQISIRIFIFTMFILEKEGRWKRKGRKTRRTVERFRESWWKSERYNFVKTP